MKTTLKRELLHYYPTAVTIILGYVILFYVENDLSYIMKWICLLPFIFLGTFIYVCFFDEYRHYDKLIKNATTEVNKTPGNIPTNTQINKESDEKES